MVSYVVVHSLLSVYCYKGRSYPKQLKAFLYYNNVLMMLVFTSFLGIKGVKGKPTIEYFADVNIATIIMPYLILGPLNMLLLQTNQGMSKKTLMHGGKEEIESAKTRIVLGRIFMVVLLISFLLVIFLTNKNKEMDDRNAWLISFFFTFIQDFLFIPLFIIIMHYTLSAFSRNFVSGHKTKQFFEKRLLSFPLRDINYVRRPKLNQSDTLGVKTDTVL